MWDSAVKAGLLSFQESFLDNIAEQFLLYLVGNWFQVLALPAHMGAMCLLEASDCGILPKSSQGTAKPVWMQGMPYMSIPSARYRRSELVVWILLTFDSPCSPLTEFTFDSLNLRHCCMRL